MKFICTTLVLDLDGTISDPSLGISRCFNHALQTHGLPTVSKDAIENEIGPPLDETFMKLAPDIAASDVAPLIATYRERYSDVGYSENVLYPDIPETLELLKTAGITLGVCTSKRRDFAERILSLFDIIDHFDFVSGGDIGITKGAQLAGLIRSGTIDDQAIMVGDRSTDIKSAQENSLRAIGVLWGFGSFEELSAAAPLCILEKVTSLSDAVI